MRTKPATRWIPLLLALLLVVPLAGCGGKDEGGSGPASTGTGTEQPEKGAGSSCSGGGKS